MSSAALPSTIERTEERFQNRPPFLPQLIDLWEDSESKVRRRTVD
jgi:hypothetical protein